MLEEYRGYMDNANRIAGCMLLFGAAMLVGVPAFAQGPARPQTPPDIAGEWRLDNNEEDTTAQPPLGDYLGIPFNDAGRQRADTTAVAMAMPAEGPSLGMAPAGT